MTDFNIQMNEKKIHNDTPKEVGFARTSGSAISGRNSSR